MNNLVKSQLAFEPFNSSNDIEDFNYVNLNLKGQGQDFLSIAIVYDFHIIQKIFEKRFITRLFQKHHMILSNMNVSLVPHIVQILFNGNKTCNMIPHDNKLNSTHDVVVVTNC